MKLKGKMVLLTGASRRIGQAVAIELARAGAHILGVDLHADSMQAPAEKATTLGVRFEALACDVSDATATAALIETIAAKFGGIDVLINNAGVLPCGPFGERDFSDWQKTIEINLLGLMALTHAALPLMIKRNEGHIVNLASVAGKFGSEGLAAYGAKCCAGRRPRKAGWSPTSRWEHHELGSFGVMDFWNDDAQ